MNALRIWLTFTFKRFQKASDGSESVVAGSDSLQIQIQLQI